MASSRQSVTIVGAGLAGSVLAAQLGQRGIEVDVYERRPDPRVTGAERGRSINLALSARGLAAITQLGLRQEVLARALPMRGRTVHPVRGDTAYQPYSADGTRAINSISRSELNAILLDLRREVTRCPHPLRAPRDRRRSREGRADAGHPRGDQQGHLGRDPRQRRRLQRRPRVAAVPRGLQLQPGLPRPRLQGAHHRGRAGRPAPARPALPAHLAPGQLHDDRPAQPRRVLHLHPVLAEERSGRARLAADADGDHLLLRAELSRRRSADARPRRGLPGEPRGLAGDRPLPAVGLGPGRARRRRRARHRAVLRAGRERCHGGLRRAGPLLRRGPRRLAGDAGGVPEAAQAQHRRHRGLRAAELRRDAGLGRLQRLPRQDGAPARPRTRQRRALHLPLRAGVVLDGALRGHRAEAATAGPRARSGCARRVGVVLLSVLSRRRHAG